jgi:GNAT superfamily N-acetyltransferase
MILTAFNVAAWLVLQLGIAAASTRISHNYFARDNWYYRVRGWETGFYRRSLRIRRWKRLLPDGAPWVGGQFSKRNLERRDPAYLRQLAIETRRGEVAHWLMLACFPVFFLWNPPWAWVVMAAYAVAANLPCIIVQRYNREVVREFLRRRDIRIVRLSKSNADAIRLLREYYLAVNVVQRDTPKAIEKIIAAPCSGMWLAYLGAKAVGCVVLRKLGSIPSSGECKRLYVQPAARGHHIADRLLDAQEDFARSAGLQWIYLDSYDDLKAAIALYRKRGYVSCERYNDNPQATVFLRKHIGSPS